MLPTTIVIRPPAFDPMAAYGIGGIALLVAIVWIVLFSRSSIRRALVLAIAVIMLMALSAAAASLECFPNSTASRDAYYDRIGISLLFCPWLVLVRA